MTNRTDVTADAPGGQGCDSPRHPLRVRAPPLVGYLVCSGAGAVAGVIVTLFLVLAVDTLVANVVDTTVANPTLRRSVLGGLLFGGVWGGVGWYALENEDLAAVALSYPYLLLLSLGIVLTDLVRDVVGIGDTTEAGWLVFVVGTLGLFVAWFLVAREVRPRLYDAL